MRREITKKIRDSMLEKDNSKIEIHREKVIEKSKEDIENIIKSYNIIREELIGRNYECSISFDYLGTTDFIYYIILYLSIS